MYNTLEAVAVQQPEHLSANPVIMYQSPQQNGNFFHWPGLSSLLRNHNIGPVTHRILISVKILICRHIINTSWYKKGILYFCSFYTELTKQGLRSNKRISNWLTNQHCPSHRSDQLFEAFHQQGPWAFLCCNNFVCSAEVKTNYCLIHFTAIFKFLDANISIQKWN